MNTHDTPDTPDRLAYILAHPRVRELRPYWYWPTCEVCGSECGMSCKPEGNYEQVWICMQCNRDVPEPIYKFAPATEGQGPTVVQCGDLSRDDNLHLLLSLADDVTNDHVSIMWHGLIGEFNCGGWCGKTRSAAVINALYRALGGEG